MTQEMQQLAAQRAEELATRAGRAASVLRDGRVLPISGERFRVRSTDGRHVYIVGPGTCSCPDFTWRGEVPCKHLIAVDLVAHPLRPIGAESDRTG